LPVDVLVVIDQDAGPRAWVANSDSGNARILETTAENVEANSSKVVIHVAGNRVRSVLEVLSQRASGFFTMALVKFSLGCESELLMLVSEFLI
jgi:hypothetical protein